MVGQNSGSIRELPYERRYCSTAASSAFNVDHSYFLRCGDSCRCICLVNCFAYHELSATSAAVHTISRGLHITRHKSLPAIRRAACGAIFTAISAVLLLGISRGAGRRCAIVSGWRYRTSSTPVSIAFFLPGLRFAEHISWMRGIRHRGALAYAPHIANHHATDGESHHACLAHKTPGNTFISYLMVVFHYLLTRLTATAPRTDFHRCAAPRSSPRAAALLTAPFRHLPTAHRTREHTPRLPTHRTLRCDTCAATHATCYRPALRACTMALNLKRTSPVNIKAVTSSHCGLPSHFTSSSTTLFFFSMYTVILLPPLFACCSAVHAN